MSGTLMQGVLVPLLAVVLGAEPVQFRADPSVTPYPLSSGNGPWMVLVMGFHGPEAVEYANTLATELRRDHNIPTYVIVRIPESSHAPVDANGVVGKVRQYRQSAVLAGDFSTMDQAKKFCERVRKIRPKCITRDMVPPMRWRRGPLCRAFVVYNPLAPKDRRKKGIVDDPFILKLNKGPYSLFNCPGTYTLLVLHLGGEVVPVGQEHLLSDGRGLLEQAGEMAELVVRELRKDGFQAYTFHDRYSSRVFVGSFSSPKDPRIQQLAKAVAGKKVLAVTLLPRPLIWRVPERAEN
jgi:hypothetical protein